MASSYSIYTQEPNKPAPQRGTDPEHRRRNIATGIGMSMMVLVAALVWWVWPSRPPSPTGSAKAVLTFVGSEQFNRLPTGQKQVYVDRVWELRDNNYGLTDEQLQQARENAGIARMEKRLDDYFQLARGKARDDYINKMMQEQMARWATSRPSTRPTTRPGGPAFAGRGGPGGPGGRNWAPNEAKMKSRLESSNPARRAQMAEFFADMRSKFAPMGGMMGGRGGR